MKVMDDKIIKKIISLIQSKAMKEYLSKHTPNWTLQQAATVICKNADKKSRIDVFTELLAVAENDHEKELLKAAIKDMKRHGFTPKATEKIYNMYFGGIARPKYAFLEVCNLPVLFRAGDVIGYNDGYAFIQAIPQLTKYSDITDECYLVIDLNCKNPSSEDERFASHEHIPLFEADYADESDLSDMQRNNLHTLRELLGKSIL